MTVEGLPVLAGLLVEPANVVGSLGRDGEGHGGLSREGVSLRGRGRGREEGRSRGRSRGEGRRGEGREGKGEKRSTCKWSNLFCSLKST